tara:strand:+ start:236 stop:703 length:468 start_codon:yes stop_codon:yes gene_type:complete
MNTWLDDKLCKKCINCSVKFTFFTRKHHCRSCGLIFCSSCLKTIVYNGCKTKVCIKCKNKKRTYIDYLISELNNKEYKIKYLNKVLNNKNKELNNKKKELENIWDIYQKHKQSIKYDSKLIQTDSDLKEKDNFQCENEIKKNDFNILEYLKNLKH